MILVVMIFVVFVSVEIKVSIWFSFDGVVAVKSDWVKIVGVKIEDGVSD